MAEEELITLHDKLADVQRRIAGACERAGRAPETVRLVAVSKKQSAEAIRSLVEAGHRLFGENRVQELRAKVPLLPGDVIWHLIGPLQRNKVRQVLPLVRMIESVDSLEVATAINKVAAELGLFPEVLLEINLAGEASKHGFSPDAMEGVIEQLLEMDRLEIRGLMAVPPIVEEPEAARPFFVRLRELRDRLETDLRIGLPELSMGMSGDFEVAIEEGATIVRVGTALFGARQG